MWVPPGERPGHPDRVILLIVRRREQQSLTVEQSALAAEDNHVYEHVRRGEHDISVTNLPGSHTIMAKLEIAGTHARATGTLSRDEVLGVLSQLTAAKLA